MYAWLLYFMTCWMPTPAPGPVEGAGTLWLRLQHTTNYLGLDRTWPALDLPTGYQSADCLMVEADLPLAQVCFLSFPEPTAASSYQAVLGTGWSTAQYEPTTLMLARGDAELVELALGTPATSPELQLRLRPPSNAAPELWFFRAPANPPADWRDRLD